MPQDTLHDMLTGDSGKGLVLSGNKPLPEPMLIKSYDIMWQHQALMLNEEE